MNKKLYTIKMSNGDIYGVPASVIADSYAAEYMARGEKYEENFNTMMCWFDTQDYEFADWAKNNMNWEDVKDKATLLSKGSISNFQDDWVNGEYGFSSGEKEKTPSKERNCTCCVHGLFPECSELTENKEYQAICKSARAKADKRDFSEMNLAYQYKQNHICDNFTNLRIEYPIIISKIKCDMKANNHQQSKKVGSFVSVKPCDDKYGDKTYLGILLGDMPIGAICSYDNSSLELTINSSNNPAIFIFALNKVIYGCESYWHIIESEDELKQISEADIDNTWYVKALQQMAKNSHSRD